MFARARFLVQISGLYVLAMGVNPAMPKMEPYLPPVYVIKRDPGGITEDFDAMYKRMDQAGARIILEGDCDSSCTRMLFARYRNIDICAQPGATFQFHQSYVLENHPKVKILWDSPKSRRIAKRLWRTDWLANFPRPVRMALAHRHIPSPTAGEWDMVVIPAVQLTKACPAVTQSLTRHAPHVIVRDIADGNDGIPVERRAR